MKPIYCEYCGEDQIACSCRQTVTVVTSKTVEAGYSSCPAHGSAANPVTYRMIGIQSKTPDASVRCNCKWDAGHEPTCDIVKANEYIRRQNDGAVPRPENP